LDNLSLQTAEMPGFYAEGEYDFSGFAVGIVKKDEVIDGKKLLREISL
jgi:phosphoribosylformylglycinamidine cyclo-ligase